MVNLNRKNTILIHIQKYCDEIVKTLKFFGAKYEIFKENDIFRDSISMKIFQIGELVKELDRLGREYLNNTRDKVPWKSIIRMRERFAHHYGEMNSAIIFSVATKDIPELKIFIQKELKN